MPSNLSRFIKTTFPYIYSRGNYNNLKMLGATLIDIVTTLINVAAPVIIIDNVSDRLSPTGSNNTSTNDNGVAPLIVGAGALLVAQSLPKLRNFLIDSVRANVQKQLTSAMIGKSFSIELDHMLTTRTGEIAQAITKNYTTIDKAMPSLYSEILPNTMDILAASIVLTDRYGPVGLLQIGVLISYLAISLMGEKSAQKIRKDCSDMSYKTYGEIIEIINNYQIAHQCGNVEYEVEKASNLLAKLEILYRKNNQKDDKNALLLSLINSAAFVGILTLIGLKPPKENFGITDYGLFAYFMMKFNAHLETLTKSVSSFHTAMTDSEKIINFLNRQSATEDPNEPQDFNITGAPSVEFKKVSFSYGTERILNEVSFSIEPGQKVAIVGPTASGKSTIVKLLQRFYSLKENEGGIFINGCNVAKVKANKLRAALAIVSQDSNLFNNTIIENVRYGDLSADDSEVFEAITSAELMKGNESNYVAISSDGKLLASGNYDGNIEIWDVTSMSILKIIKKGHTRTVERVFFIANGTQLITASEDGTIWLWDISSGETIHTFGDHKGGVSSIAVSLDEKMLASGGKDNVVKVWDLVSGHLIGDLIGHTSHVTTLAFNSDGSQLASGSKDRSIRLWDLQSRKNLKILLGHAESVCSVSFSVDKPWLASGSEDKTVRIWDLNDGNIVKVLIGHKDPIRNVTFTASSDQLISMSRDIVKIWDTTTGKPLDAVAAQREVKKIAFSPDRKFFRIISKDSDSFNEVSSDVILSTFFQTLGGYSECTEKLRSNIGQLGGRLSGGEKQRVNIARASLKGGWIYILDEATSALDKKTEFEVQQMLDGLTANLTTLVITHSLNTIINSDQILYLENGSIIENGTFNELMQKNGKFYEQFRIQCDDLGISAENIKPVRREIEHNEKLNSFLRHRQQVFADRFANISGKAANNSTNDSSVISPVVFSRASKKLAVKNTERTPLLTNDQFSLSIIDLEEEKKMGGSKRKKNIQ